MAELNGVYCASRMWFFALISLICLTLTGCLGDSNHSGKKNNNSGDLQVRMVWQTDTPQSIPIRTSPGEDVCIDFSITGIQIHVKDASGKVVAESALLPCSDHKARLDGIAAQSGYTVEVEGHVGDQVRWFGRKEGVTVVTGKSTEPIMVTMNYNGDTSEALSATIFPEHLATKTPTNTTVTVQFNKAVVAATVNQESIYVTDGEEPVLGALTYNPETFEVVFQPDQEFAVSTLFTISVTTKVMDQEGQYLAKDITSEFSTTTVWYVDAGKSKSGSGQSWDEAFCSIADALAAASNGDQIWVKQGLYQSESQIILNKSVELLGGFKGTERQHHQRDWITHETVVDGKGEHRCFYISSNATIDGFTITRGFLHSDTDLFVFETHAGGGGMYIHGSSPSIVNCKFTDNTIDPNIFGGNGGAIYIDAGNPFIHASTFKDNYLAGGYGGGGAIFNSQGGPIISNCIFRNNNVDAWKGSYGGAIDHNHATSNTAVTNCLFENNTVNGRAGSGGAIANRDSHYTISGCRFINNTSSSGEVSTAGAISNLTSNVTLQNNIFYRNSVNSDRPYGFLLSGGAVYNSGSSVSIVNCTFLDNIAPNDIAHEHREYTKSFGGAIYSENESKLSIVNTIIWCKQTGTAAQLYYDETSSLDISFSNFDNSNIDGNDYTGSRNTTLNPRFGADFHLKADSPCIGKADDTKASSVDIDGESRAQGIPADIGADQFVDNDNDQMPDYWEVHHTVGDPDGDEDDDQLSNLDEYHLGTDPKKAQTISNASHRGTVSADGHHQASDLASLCGWTNRQKHNVFFVFDVQDTASLKSAALRLELVGYHSNNIPSFIKIWDVSTTVETLAQDSNGQAGAKIYLDLMDGVRYGDFDMTPNDKAKVHTILLNQAAIDAIKSAGTGSGKFIIGISSDGEIGSGHLAFSEANENRIHQLILDRN